MSVGQGQDTKDSSIRNMSRKNSVEVLVVEDLMLGFEARDLLRALVVPLRVGSLARISGGILCQHLLHDCDRHLPLVMCSIGFDG